MFRETICLVLTIIAAMLLTQSLNAYVICVGVRVRAFLYTFICNFPSDPDIYAIVVSK